MKGKGKKKIRFGIIGCGGFVRYHCRGIRDTVPEFQCVGLCDIIPERTVKLRDEFFVKDDPAHFVDYRDMLREVKPDAVLVSTPHTLHFRHAYDSLSAGAGVMVDKPMVTNADDARKVVSFAKRKKRVFQVAIQGTYTDTFAYARQLLTDGTMGKLQLVTGILAQGWMKFTTGAWRQDPKLSGGGQMYDSGAHVLSAMMFLVDSPVREVFCWTDNKGRRVDINAVATVRFANGTLATMTSGGNCASWRSHLILQGENAQMDISPHGGDFRVQGSGLKKDITAVPRGWKVPTVSPVRNFADALQGKAKPRCAGRVGILLADVMDGFYASAAKGRPVRVTRRVPR
ncbi:MAG TPA: Gfo/Idh/MocA family oxidoreductase [Planctomycetota bacterium]|nr:Gfo/Idh/MocA family oxidoreductase [Planctomycetota bacterium]